MTNFNKTHKTLDHFEPSPSLLSLVSKAGEIASITIERVLEVGCGQGLNLHEYPNVVGIDISESAILKAQVNFPRHHFVNLSSLKISKLNSSFSLILDAHQVHYLQSRCEIKQYFTEVFSALEFGGLFCFEAMITHKEMIDASVGSLVLDSIEYEEILKECGFSIKYLMIPRGRKFIADQKRKAALSSDPDVLLVIATKEDAAK